MNLKNISKRALAIMLTLMLVMPFAGNISYAQANSSVQSPSEATASNIEKQMEFLYVESPELEAPGTQNIVISWDESIKKADSLELVYTDAEGNTYTISESERTATSVLFSREFSTAGTGDYTITGVNYTIGETTGFFQFDDVEIKATFKVKDTATEQPEDQQILIAPQTADSIDESQIESMVTATLDSAAVPATTVKKDLVVVLDPGHGSKEAGSSGNGLKEHELNIKIAEYLKDELSKYNDIQIYLTHDGSGFDGSDADRMQARVDFASSVKADVLLSIHVNSTGTGVGQGAEVWYPNENYVPECNTIGKPLAQSVQDELVKLGLKDRGIKGKSTQYDKYPDGTLRDWYGIIRRCKLAGIPAIIIEHAFIDNESDVEKFLSSDEKLLELAKADAAGVVNYFGLTPKVEGTVTADAESVAEAINKLTDIAITKDSLTDSKATVAAIRAAYDSLSEMDKSLLGPEAELEITKAERDIATLEKEIADAEKEAAKAEKEAADKVLSVVRSSVGTVKLSTKYTTATKATLNYSWNQVANAEKYMVVLYKNGKKTSTMYTSKTALSFADRSRGYNYTVKVTPYIKHDGSTYYGKAVSKTSKISHKAPSLTISKSGNYRVIKATDRNSTGYQVYISTSSKFDKNVKKYKFSTSSNSLNKKLLATKYFYKGKNYVKVRAYTTYNGETVYSNWSTYKTVSR